MNERMQTVVNWGPNVTGQQVDIVQDPNIRYVLANGDANAWDAVQMSLAEYSLTAFTLLSTGQILGGLICLAAVLLIISFGLGLFVPALRYVERDRNRIVKVRRLATYMLFLRPPEGLNRSPL